LFFSYLCCRTQTKGFVPVAQENGMLIAYSTAENELASDAGAGAGPYAKVLAEEIVKQGIEAVTMFREVQRRVRATIRQEPYLGFSAMGDLYLGGKPDATVSRPAPVTTGVPTYEQQAELTFWSSVKDSKDPAVLQVYLDKYPSGTFADLARQLIAQANRESEARRAEAAERAAEAQRIEAERKARAAEDAKQQDQRKAFEATEAARKKTDEEARAKAEADRQRLAAMVLKQQEEESARANATLVLPMPRSVSCANQSSQRKLDGGARTNFMAKCQACEKESIDRNYVGVAKIFFVNSCIATLTDKPLDCSGLAGLFNLAGVDLIRFMTKCEGARAGCEKSFLEHKIMPKSKNAFVTRCIVSDMERDLRVQ
jgi:hypothetical protein